jgi:hypothetical protein
MTRSSSFSAGGSARPFAPALFVCQSRHLQRDGEYAPKPARFWLSIHRRAAEFPGSDADLGRNYLMTEVVHGKSTAGTGAASAAPTCAGRYLADILALTAAPGTPYRIAAVTKWNSNLREQKDDSVNCGSSLGRL